jgi:hypothetical protein
MPLSRNSRQSQLAIVFTQFPAQRFNHQFMIGALRQTRHSNASDHAGPVHANRKRAAVRRILRDRQPIFLEQARAQLQSDNVRAAMKSRHQVALPAHPFRIVGRSARKRGVEQRLPEAPYVDHQAMLSRRRYLPQPRSQAPRGILIKAGEMKFSLLRGNRRQVIFPWCHNASLRREMCAGILLPRIDSSKRVGT